MGQLGQCYGRWCTGSLYCQVNTIQIIGDILKVQLDLPWRWSSTILCSDLVWSDDIGCIYRFLFHQSNCWWETNQNNQQTDKTVNWHKNIFSLQMTWHSGQVEYKTFMQTFIVSSNNRDHVAYSTWTMQLLLHVNLHVIQYVYTKNRGIN